MLTFNDLLRATIIAKCDAVIKPTPENVALAASFDRITRAAATDMIFDTVYQRRIFKAEPKPKAPEYTEGQAYAVANIGRTIGRSPISKVSGQPTSTRPRSSKLRRDRSHRGSLVLH